MLTLILNQSIPTFQLHRCIPLTKCRIPRVIPLFKKGDNQLLENYRSVSILPVIPKNFERIIHDQMIQYSEEYSLLHSSQYGFRKNHSTDLAALELINRITLTFKSNKMSLGILMDLSKAFDSLAYTILLHKHP